MAAGKQQPIGSGFGSKTTAGEVMDGVDLAGKTAVVTGGYSGIGLETTRALARAGADVVAPARDTEKAEKAFAAAGLSVETRAMDLGDLASVQNFAAEFAGGRDRVHLLINNAGIMACPETRTGPDWERQFAVNHIGHFVLTQELAPYLTNAGGARVVCLSSLAHRRSPIRWDDIHFANGDYDKWIAYGQSKTANALFALELDRRMDEEGVKAFSVHPGTIMTSLMRHIDRAEMTALGWIDEAGEATDILRSILKSPEQGCATTLWCATSLALAGRGGEYCEDCDIAALADHDGLRYSLVSPHAVDAEAAARLWEETEAMVTAD